MFINEEVDVGQMTLGRVIRAHFWHDATHVNYTVPQEGAMIYFDEFCIPTNAQRPDAAYEWIDWYTADQGPNFTEHEAYRSVEEDLVEKLDTEWADWLEFTDQYDLIPQDNLSAEVRDRYTEIWENVRG